METEIETNTIETGRNYRPIILAVLVLLIVGVVVYFLLNKKSEVVNASLVNDSNKTSISVVPLSDEHGMTSTDYVDFTVSSVTDKKRIYYEVIISPKSTNTIDVSSLKTYLTDQSNNKITGVVLYSSLDSAENGKIIYRGLTKLSNDNTPVKDSKDFRLRAWLNNNYNSDISGAFEFNISINAYYVDDNFTIQASAPLTFKVTNGNVLTNENIMTNIITESDGMLSCSSSDATVASCSVSGKALVINGIKDGNATITVNQAAGSIYTQSGTATFDVIVSTSKIASALTLSSESGLVYFGIDKVLNIDTTGDGVLSCSSSDEKIATCAITEKVLTIKGVAEGSATITVNQTEGETTLAPNPVTYTIDGVKKTAAATLSTVSELKTTPFGKIYAGENPNNYIWFNNEQWRIIGLYGDSIKIVRATPFATGQTYNSSDKSGNAWGSSEIKEYLYSSYESIISDEKSRELVLENATWYIGETIPQKNAAAVYDDATKEEWNGKIGLITSYEYQYASSESCWSKNGDTYKTCGKDNWLYNTLMSDGNKVGSWTMSPDTKAGRALRVHPQRFVDDNPVSSAISISPVVYLKAAISITGGSGQIGEEGSYKLG